jgi:hypothetical protein
MNKVINLNEYRAKKKTQVLYKSPYKVDFKKIFISHPLDESPDLEKLKEIKAVLEQIISQLNSEDQ